MWRQALISYPRCAYALTLKILQGMESSGTGGLSAASYSRDPTPAAPPAAASSTPGVSQPPQLTREEQEEAEARRLRQLALQQDAARTLGKNAATFKSSDKSSTSEPPCAQGSAEASSDDFFSSSVGSSQGRSAEAEISEAVAEQSAEDAQQEKAQEARVVADEGASNPVPPVPTPAPAPPPPAPVVNYKEAWREAANRNLFSILSNSRKARSSATLTSAATGSEAPPPSPNDVASQVPSPPPPPPGLKSDQVLSSGEGDLDAAQLDALPILEQYSAAPLASKSSEVEAEAQKAEAEELAELEVVGDEMVSAKVQQQQQRSRDVWKVIAPNGLVVHAGPGDDYKPLGRLRAFQLVEVDEQQGVWLKLAQAVDSEVGWVRKEEGRGKRGGGLARTDAALMVKQGKVLGFDSEAMSKWKVNS